MWRGSILHIVVQRVVARERLEGSLNYLLLSHSTVVSNDGVNSTLSLVSGRYNL